MLKLVVVGGKTSNDGASKQRPWILRLPSNRSTPNSTSVTGRDRINPNMSKVEVTREYFNNVGFMAYRTFLGIQEFEKLLKAAVGGKRLSQSKMTALTELALGNFEVRLIQGE